MRKWKTGLPAVSVLTALFCLGYITAQKTWNGEVFILLEKNPVPDHIRSIASQEMVFLTGPDLTSENKQAFLDQATVNQEGGNTTLFLPHFLTAGDGGEPVLACHQYPVVHITFSALGVSIHGHAPEMTLATKCPTNQNHSSQMMGPFIIPKDKILSSSVHETEFKQDASTVQFHHVSLLWPKTWMLDHIRFINSNKDTEMKIDMNNTESPLIFNWQ